MWEYTKYLLLNENNLNSHWSFFQLFFFFTTTYIIRPTSLFVLFYLNEPVFFLFFLGEIKILHRCTKWISSTRKYKTLNGRCSVFKKGIQLLLMIVVMMWWLLFFSFIPRYIFSKTQVYHLLFRFMVCFIFTL